MEKIKNVMKIKEEPELVKDVNEEQEEGLQD